MRDDSNENLADQAIAASDQHTEACLQAHRLGLTLPTKRLGPAVTLANEPIDFELGVETLGLRVSTRLTQENLPVTVKVARTSLETRGGLRPATPEEADDFLAAMRALPTDERPKLSLVQVSGQNGSTVVRVANCRSETGFEVAQAYLAPSEFILAVVPLQTKNSKKKPAKAGA